MAKGAAGAWEPGTDAVVVDVETTGTDAAVDRVVALGMARVAKGEITGGWESLVKIPKDDWDRQEASAQAVHGIEWDQVRRAQAWPKVWDKAQGWLEEQGVDLEKGLVIAHNAVFDRGFLVWEQRRNGADADAHAWTEDGAAPWVDTLEMARERFGSGRKAARYSLDALAKRVGVKGRGKGEVHEAGSDARLLAEVWIAWGHQARAAQADLFGDTGKAEEGPLPPPIPFEDGEEIREGYWRWRAAGERART